MSWYPKFRDVHLWVGLIVMIPVLVIAATGIGLNHEEALGLKHLEKEQKGKKPDKEGSKKRNHTEAQASSLRIAPNEQHRNDAPPPSEIVESSARLETTDGSWTSNAEGIDAAVAAARELWGMDVPLERIELKHEHSLGMVVKVKAAKSVDVEPDEIVWSVTEKSRLLRPEDQPHASGFAGVNWAKVVKELHTGKFFSKRHGYWWSDVAATSLLLLSATGLVLYVIPVVKKAAKKGKAAAARPVASPRPGLPRNPATINGIPSNGTGAA